jgi:hypothetical protein
MPFGLLWELTARPAIAAEMLRRFPHKAPSIHPDRGAVSLFLEGLGTAWRCYHAGAAAALFDVEAAIQQAGLPLPDEVSCELVHLARCAMSGEALKGGQGRAPPLERHKANLRKRRRYLAVQWQLDSAWHYAAMDDPSHGAIATGADPALFAAWKAERPEASAEPSARAAKLAAAALGEGMVGERAIYNDFREVEAAARDRATWPGAFYLPSRDTCEWLGWAEALAPLCDEEPSDGPAWCVA